MNAKTSEIQTDSRTPAAAHTPGPWCVAHSPTYGNPFVTNSTGKLSLTGNIGPKDVQMAEANARLIAAAPEMLAALREITVHLSAQAGGYLAPELWQYTRERLIAMGESAIAAATGEKGGSAL